MQYKDSLELLLRDCRFMPDAVELDRLIPSATKYIPPFTAVTFADTASPRFWWGLPVVHSRRLLRRLYVLFGQLAIRAIRDPRYQENLTGLTPEQLKEDPYFREVSDLLIKTLAEGEFLKLDTVLWIYITDLISRRMNQNDELDVLARRDFSDEFSKFEKIDGEIGRLKYREPVRCASVKNRILRSLLARHDFAISCMSEIFDVVPQNPIVKGLAECRFIFTEKSDALYQELDVTEAFLVRQYRLSHEEFTGLNNVMRAVIRGILERRRAGNLLPMDTYFLKTVDLELAYDRSLRGVRKGQKEGEVDDLDHVARYLSLQEAPTRYLFYHLAELSRYYVKPVERQLSLSRYLVRSLKDPQKMVSYEAAYSEVVQDILRWDFFNVLRRRINWVNVDDKAMSVGRRPLDPATVPLNLGAYNEAYKRSRHGTAVFFDLIGFTARTKALTKSKDRSHKRGEEQAKYSLLSLAIQRLFSIRQELETYGGIPQGFEGDAILDIFPNALQAIRYVSLFADNYERHQSIHFRPFERPAQNPYQDGWRVGLASGEYTVISIVGRSNEMAADIIQERAVGHTVNRASRLNSGKKGDQVLLLGEGLGGEGLSEAADPLEIFRVKVDGKRKLNNNGVCSFEDTFLEIKANVKAECLPYFEPATGEGGHIHGILPRFKYYNFALIFAEPSLGKVFLVRKLPIEPELKGLEDETNTVFEYVMVSVEAFLELFHGDQNYEGTFTPPQAEAAAPAATVKMAPAHAQDLGVLNRRRIAKIAALEADGHSIHRMPERDYRWMSDAEKSEWYPQGVPEDEAEAPPAATPTAPAAAGQAQGERPVEPPSSSAPSSPAGGGPIQGQGGHPTRHGAIPPTAASDGSTLDIRLRPGQASPDDAIEMIAAAQGQRAQEALSFLDGEIPGEGGLEMGSLGGIARQMATDMGREDAYLMDPNAVKGLEVGQKAAHQPALVAKVETPLILSASLVSSDGEGVGANALSASLAGPQGGDIGGGALSPALGADSDGPSSSAGQGPAASLQAEGDSIEGDALSASLQGEVEALGGGALKASLQGEGGPDSKIQIQGSEKGPAAPQRGGSGQHSVGGRREAQGAAPAPTQDAIHPPMPQKPAQRQVEPLERDDFEGFAYVLEMGAGPNHPPTAILVGNPRQDALQDCHRYRAEDFAPESWTLDAVLRRFVIDLAIDLDAGRYYPTEKVPEGQTVYLLEAGYLFGLQGG